MKNQIQSSLLIDVQFWCKFCKVYNVYIYSRVWSFFVSIIYEIAKYEIIELRQWLPPIIWWEMGFSIIYADSDHFGQTKFYSKYLTSSSVILIARNLLFISDIMNKWLAQNKHHSHARIQLSIMANQFWPKAWEMVDQTLNIKFNSNNNQNKHVTTNVSMRIYGKWWTIKKEPHLVSTLIDSIRSNSIGMQRENCS